VPPPKESSAPRSKTISNDEAESKGWAQTLPVNYARRNDPKRPRAEAVSFYSANTNPSPSPNSPSNSNSPSPNSNPSPNSPSSPTVTSPIKRYDSSPSLPNYSRDTAKPPPVPSRDNIPISPPQQQKSNKTEGADTQDKSYDQISIEILLKRIGQLTEENKEKEDKLAKQGVEHREALESVTDKLRKLGVIREQEKQVWVQKLDEMEKKNKMLIAELKTVQDDVRKEYVEVLRAQEVGMVELEKLLGEYEKKENNNALKIELKVKIESKEKEVENLKKMMLRKERQMKDYEERFTKSKN